MEQEKENTKQDLNKDVKKQPMPIDIKRFLREKGWDKDLRNKETMER